MIRSSLRDHRQRVVAEWTLRTFGAESMTIEQRTLRFLEEALEVAQCFVSKEDAQRLLDYVYTRPVGNPKQEIGGVGVTLLVLAEVLGLSASAEEMRESDRVRAIPRDVFRARHNAKAAAGIAVPAPDVEVG